MGNYKARMALFLLMVLILPATRFQLILDPAMNPKIDSALSADLRLRIIFDGGFKLRV